MHIQFQLTPRVAEKISLSDNLKAILKSVHFGVRMQYVKCAGSQSLSQRED